MDKTKVVDKPNAVDMPEIVKIKDIAPPDFELPKLEAVKGKTIFLIDFMLDVSQFGEYAVIFTRGQGNFVTTSETVIKQLKRLARHISANGIELGKKKVIEATVKATKTEKGEYYMLT